MAENSNNHKKHKTEVKHVEEQGFGTRAIHAGQLPDPSTGAVCVPISLATTFVQESPGTHKGYDYSRSGNPTRAALEACLASLEHAKYGLAFASGLAASTTILHSLKSGDHVICIDDVYGGTNRLFNRVSHPSMNLNFTLVDFHQEGAFEKAITDKTKLVWIETPTNPTLKIVDIQQIAEVAHKHKLLLMVDNTFMSPALQNPLLLGADIVMHSISKYINGHSDVIMGFLATNDEQLYARLKFLQNSVGAVPSPFDCFMVLRGVKTLHIRMREHCKNATAVAEFLESHPKVNKVIYPGLKSHPQHEIAKKQTKGFGGMITFYIKGGLEEARTFLENLKVFALAESLGAVESLAEHPAIMTHASVPPDQRKALGIDDTLIRLSVGIEDLKDLLADLTQALDAVGSK